jgi:hypothetical protein
MNSTGPRKPGGYAVNLQDSHDSKGNPLPGSHWVALWTDPDGQSAYFDSYGVTVPEAVKRLVKPLVTGLRVPPSRPSPLSQGFVGTVLSTSFTRCNVTGRSPSSNGSTALSQVVH